MEHFFSTFCHVTDYGKQGFRLIPQMLETSYPLVLWAPPGATVNKFYQSGTCPIASGKTYRICREGLYPRYR